MKPCVLIASYAVNSFHPACYVKKQKHNRIKPISKVQEMGLCVKEVGAMRKKLTAMQIIESNVRTKVGNACIEVAQVRRSNRTQKQPFTKVRGCCVLMRKSGQ